MDSNNNSFIEYDENQEDLSNYFPTIIPLNEEKNNLEIYPFNEGDGNILKKYQSSHKFNTSRKEKDKKRKEKYDNIRKKIKTNFLKRLREIINDKLKIAGSKEYFESLPQTFMSNISFKINCNALDLTYEELIEQTYTDMINQFKEIYPNKKKILNIAEKKYKKNKKTLSYLNRNSMISEKSGWNRIKDKKYINLFKAYINSKEFEQSIENLSKKEKFNYINDYIHCALTYIEHFSKN